MLVNNGKVEKEFLTLHGVISYKRTLLAPADKGNSEELLELDGKNSIYPIDDILDVSRLPFKITCRMTSHIAKEATCAHSLY